MSDFFVAPPTARQMSIAPLREVLRWISWFWRTASGAFLTADKMNLNRFAGPRSPTSLATEKWTWPRCPRPRCPRRTP